ncbi:glycosyltransferase family 4 protein [Rhodococcus jostii]|uniref:glycosyltransferase family 4 protein n=1 Tax=Rhodococcus jostii TaxID=132919 RepID=UPI001F07DFD3|nr:glycosyltransferase family 4 protein [Rhodococcus jostii]
MRTDGVWSGGSGKRPKKLIAVHPSDEMYGADRVFLEALTDIPSDWDVEVWLPTDVEYPGSELSTALAELGHTVRRVPLPVIRRSYLRLGALPGLLGRFLRTAGAVVRARPSKMYVNTSALVLLLPLARLSGAATILHLHEFLDRKTAPFVTPFMSFAQRIVCVSNAVRRPLPAKFDERSVVVYNGFELPVPTPFAGDERLVCVVASRWNTWKGHDVLLDAWDGLERSDIELIVLGAPPLNGASVDVVDRVEKLKRPHSVSIVGQTDDVRSYLDAAHLVLVPSIKPDPLPTIAIEAMAAGRAVMASDSGGLPEIIGDDVGCLVRTGDVAAWTQALEEFSLEDATERADQARRRFEAQFGVHRFRDEIGKEIWT